MDPTIAYAIIWLIAALEGGEFALLAASFFIRYADLTYGASVLVLASAFILSDLVWYAKGGVLYRIPFLRRLDTALQSLDANIRTRPYAVALLARFSYGTHHATIARYRANGVRPWTMVGITIGTLAPWLLVAGVVVMGVGLVTPIVGPAFRYVEIVFAIAFMFFFIAELRVSARVGEATLALNRAGRFVWLWSKQAVRVLSVLYGLLIAVLLGVVVTTPLLVRSGFSFFTEEAVEVSLLGAVSVLGLYVYRGYLQSLHNVEEKYDEISRYVGALNLQTVQIDAMFKQMTRIPESKRDVKQLIEHLNANVLAAVPVPWVLTRVIDGRTGRTLTEQTTTRADYEEDSLPHVSNRAALGLIRPRGYYVYRSDHANTYVRTICAVPKRTLNQHQELVIRSAVNNIALLYLVFTSRMMQLETGERVESDHEQTHSS